MLLFAQVRTHDGSASGMGCYVAVLTWFAADSCACIVRDLHPSIRYQAAWKVSS